MLDEKITREALKCCTDNRDRCAECPLDRLITCKEQLIISAYNLVNQLDEDNAWLVQQNEIYEALNKKLEDACEAYAWQYGEPVSKQLFLQKERVDTVKKMQSEIEVRCIAGGIYPAFVKSTISKVVEDMLGETDVGIS